MKTKHFIKEKEFVGLPTAANFKLVEEDIDENLQPGGNVLLNETICVYGDILLTVVICSLYR